MSSYCENLKDMTWFPCQKTKAESWRGKLDSNNSPIIYLWWAELMTLAILGRKQLNSHFEATLMQSLVRSPKRPARSSKWRLFWKPVCELETKAQDLPFAQHRDKGPPWTLTSELLRAAQALAGWHCQPPQTTTPNSNPIYSSNPGHVWSNIRCHQQNAYPSLKMRRYL